jgi:saccharopine dehydrogenase-like NADP-dependent oxidoreductase
MILDVEDIATFEAYTNRDALPYREIYGLNGAKTVFRGTLRNVGWCYKMKKVQELGLFDDSPRGDLEGLTYRGLMLRLIGQQESKDIVADTARYLGVEKHATVMKRFQWLGLFDDKPLPDEDNVMDMFCALLQEKLAMGKDDLDLIVLHHQFVAEYPGRSELLTSTLVNTGLPDGDSAMARTVGLPAAIAAAMILEGELSLTGVRIPVLPEIYEPVLAELERREIRIEERVRPLEVEDELRVGIY